MREITELFLIGAFVLFVSFFLLIMLCWMTITPYTNYQLKKKENKIQWRCQETYESRKKILNGESDVHICDLSYRIIPSEVNRFTRIFGSNNWKEAFTDLEFKNKEDFQKFVKNFQTINDIKTYNNKENGILWYEP